MASHLGWRGPVPQALSRPLGAGHLHCGKRWAMGEPSAIGFTLMRGGTLSDPPGPPTLAPQQREPTDRLSPNHTTSRRARRNQPGQSSNHKHLHPPAHPLQAVHPCTSSSTTTSKPPVRPTSAFRDFPAATPSTVHDHDIHDALRLSSSCSDAEPAQPAPMTTAKYHER